jgi:uncharacterized protein YwgA
MRKIYVITFSNWDEHWIHAVYRNKSRAQEALKKLKPRHGSYDIEEWEFSD